jgi:hypothetical protein
MSPRRRRICLECFGPPSNPNYKFLMDIHFESDATDDVETGSLVFFCTADGEPVLCAITEEALTSGLHIPWEEISLPETFAKHRDKIHGIAARLIREEKWNDKGGILITQADVLEHST